MQSLVTMTDATSQLCCSAPPTVIGPDVMRRYVQTFNAGDDETIVNHVSNGQSYDWLAQNVPLFECPDADIERTYYFRWWTFRKAIGKTADGFVILEFLPDVSWAGKHNTISLAAAANLYEGRWLWNREYLDQFTTFWYRKGGEPRKYPTFLPDGIVARAKATGDWTLAEGLLPDLVEHHLAREATHMHPCGLFWSTDNGEGEISISGHGFRTTLNSYMFGDARAIAMIARRTGNNHLAEQFEEKAQAHKQLIQQRLWDEQAQFYKVYPFVPADEWYCGPIPGSLRGMSPADWSFDSVDPLRNLRELYGYLPWFFYLADNGQETAWREVTDSQGFLAPCGLTSAERRHVRYMFDHPHECRWNGPIWPWNYSLTLAAMANLLNDYQQDVVHAADYFKLLRLYALLHQRTREDGVVVPWIDECAHPETGEWLSRKELYAKSRPDRDRGKDYNHSIFCDLVISGLVGLRAFEDDRLMISPLVPEHAWDYFCLDRVPYHGRNITVLYDRDGSRYGRGAGLQVLVDGRQMAASSKLTRLVVTLSESKQ